MLFFDTETCGLHGPIVLIQYAEDDDVNLFSPWFESINSTMELLDFITYNDIIGFNLAFDWFHICQMWTTLYELKKKVGGSAILINHIEEYALCEPQARLGYCLKPQGCFDLMLYARRGPYQSMMKRKDIRIKKVPTNLAYPLAKEIGKRIDIPDIYFGRRKDSTVRWQVQDITNDLDVIDPHFKDLVLKFSPTSALKAICKDAGILKEKRLLYDEIEIDKTFNPVEYGYAPFAMAVGSPNNWKGAWPEVIKHHISHWSFNKQAREYAADDVIDTRNLYNFFGRPEINDNDSILACMVAAVRWHGYAIDIDKLRKLLNECKITKAKAPYDFGSVRVVKDYLKQVMTETEALALSESTKAQVLEEISKWKRADVCNDCYGAGCEKCDDGLIRSKEKHPAAERAIEVLRWRQLGKEIEIYEKLIRAGRFHASFVVIGTLSDRMSGADGLNPQGIKRADKVRECFPLHDNGMYLNGGDFSGFEVCIVDAVYKDPILHEELISGYKIHALFGQSVFPNMTYEEIKSTKGADNPEDDIYTRSKNGFFALIYMGEDYTLSNRVGIPIEQAAAGYERFIKKYTVFGEERQKYINMFCSMKQPGGIGTKVEWHEPADYIESMFGFRRYFTLENKICKALFELAQDVPDDWKKHNLKVKRRDREQTEVGAVQSALYAAAFAVQGATARAAGNHIIQSTGAQITKELQGEIWSLQPIGINHWVVLPMNVHDEVLTPSIPQVEDDLENIVINFIKKYKKYIPLLDMEWGRRISSWAGK
jgi:hypothetical protein